MSARGKLVLDGTGAYVDIDNVKTTANTATGAITAWFNIPIDRVGDDSAMVIMSIENSVDHILLYRNGLNEIDIRYKQGGSAISAVVAEPGTGWYFVAATWDTNGFSKIYLDDPGVGADDTTDLSAKSPFTPTAAAIGTRAIALIQDFEGELSDIMLWDTDLSQDQCEAIYDLGRNPTGTKVENITDGTPFYAELISWWPFTINGKDEKGGSHGTFQAGAYVDIEANVPCAKHHYSIAGGL